MSIVLPRITFLGGNIGTGKSELARTVSERTGAYVYSVDDVKRDIYPTDPDFEKNMREGRPFSDATRRKVFEHIVEDFPRLAQQEESVIIEETLHKKEFRGLLFDGAQKHFGGFTLVHVVADEEQVLTRLAAERQNHILTEPTKMYFGIKATFEPFDEPHITHDNSGPLEESVEILIDRLTAVQQSGPSPFKD